jgi:hypothetical protein
VEQQWVLVSIPGLDLLRSVPARSVSLQVNSSCYPIDCTALCESELQAFDAFSSETFETFLDITDDYCQKFINIITSCGHD